MTKLFSSSPFSKSGETSRLKEQLNALQAQVEALQASELHARRMLENNLTAYACCQVLYENGAPVDVVYLEANPAFENLAAFRPMAGRKASELPLGIGRGTPELLQFYHQVAATGRPDKIEIYLEAQKLWYVIVAYAECKQRIVAQFQVINERKRIITERLASEDLFNKTFRASPIGINIFRLGDGRCVDVNEAFTMQTGYSRAELIGRSAAELNLGLDPKLRAGWIDTVTDDHTLSSLQTSLRAKSGEIRHFIFSIEKLILHGEPMGMILSVDISERVRAEAEVLLQARMLDELGQAVVVTDGAGRFVYINKFSEKLFGLAAGDLLGLAAGEVIHAPANVAWLLEIQKKVTTGQPWHGEHSLTNKQGHKLVLSISATPVPGEQGGLAHVIYVFEDISERVASQQALRDSEEKFRHVLESSFDVAYRSNLQTDSYDYLSPALTHLTGYTPAEFASRPASSLAELVHPDDRAQVQQALDPSQAQEAGPFQVDYRLRCRDGAYRWFSDLFRVVCDAQGRLLYRLGTIRDVTQRKQVEQELRESEEKYRAIFVNERYAIVIYDLKSFQILDVNSAMSRLYGYSREEFLGGMSMTALFTDVEASTQAIRRTAAAGTDYIPLRYHIKKGGVAFPAEIVGGAFNWQGRQAMYALVRDISDRLRVETALQRSLARLRTAQRIGQMGSWEWDPLNNQLINSEGMYHLLRRENDPNLERFDDAMEAYVHPDDRHKLAEAAALTYQEGAEHEVEYRIIRGDGETRWIRATGEPVFQNGKLVSVIGVSQDITERVQSMKLLRASLEEKETLLREIHHRVNNNLASIIGLIDLQQESLANPQLSAEFADLSGRVQSMAAVHELLYQSESQRWIEMQDYFERLAGQLSSVYDVYKNVLVEVQAEGVRMDIDAAIPCGLIVTELVTNSYKYAFPGGLPRPGESDCRICIRAVVEGRRCSLAVSDNGAGLPGSLSLDSAASLGLRLVKMLASHQLHAEIRVDSSAGAAFGFDFELKGQEGGL